MRGSTPAPGPQFVRVGGHTSSVAVWSDAAELPHLVLDAGTGIREVTSLLQRGPFRGTILLTHLHWDHVQGLPFFTGGDRGDAEVDVVMPAQAVPPTEALARAMSPPHFPIGPQGLRGRWRFTGIEEGRHVFEGLDVLAREIPHKGGRTFGYRIDGPFGSMAYLPDHRPDGTASTTQAVQALTAGVDLLVHDAQFLPSEELLASAYGHATVDQAVEVADEADPGALVLFHHAPGRTDDEAEALLSCAITAARCPVLLAAEGLELVVGRPLTTPC